MTTKFSRSEIQINTYKSISIAGVEGNIARIIPLKSGNSGVYEIRNKQNPDRFYIGQSRDLERRKWRHFNDLIRGRHESIAMQNDFLLFKNSIFNSSDMPEDLFDFRVIAYCRPSELTFTENALIKTLNPYYNTHKEKALGGDIDLFSGWDESAEDSEAADEEMK